MLLIKLLRMIIADIDKHLYEKIGLPLTAIPEANLAGKIAKLEVPKDFLIRHQPQALDIGDAIEVPRQALDAEVNELALNLAQLKVEHDLPFYDIELRFDMTWRALVEKSPKDFFSILLNKLQAESLEDNKMIILARMKYQFQTHIKEALLNLEVRQAGWEQGRVISEDDCIDTKLFKTVGALIAEALELCAKAREQLQHSPVPQIALKSGQGKTELLLNTFDCMLKGYYQFILEFEAKNQLKPSHMHSLRDLLPMHLHVTDPIIQAHLLGMNYLLSNCREHAQAVAISGKPWSSYANVGGLLELSKDVLVTSLRNEDLSESKRSQVMDFFNAIQLYAARQGNIFEDVLKLIDTYKGASAAMTPYRNIVKEQNLTSFFKNLHDRVLEVAPEADRKKHSLCCKA